MFFFFLWSLQRRLSTKKKIVSQFVKNWGHQKMKWTLLKENATFEFQCSFFVFGGVVWYDEDDYLAPVMWSWAFLNYCSQLLSTKLFLNNWNHPFFLFLLYWERTQQYRLVFEFCLNCANFNQRRKKFRFSATTLFFSL